MSAGSSKILTKTIRLQIYILLDLALNNLRGLICRKITHSQFSVIPRTLFFFFGEEGLTILQDIQSTYSKTSQQGELAFTLRTH